MKKISITSFLSLQLFSFSVFAEEHQLFIEDHSSTNTHTRTQQNHNSQQLQQQINNIKGQLSSEDIQKAIKQLEKIKKASAHRNQELEKLMAE